MTTETKAELLKRSNAYKNTLAFFWLAALSQKTKQEANELLENYTTVFRIHETQNSSKPRIDTFHELSKLADQSMAYIKKHKYLRLCYAMQPTISNSFIRSSENYYDIWKQERQKS
jgi:hypothetical protein